MLILALFNGFWAEFLVFCHKKKSGLCIVHAVSLCYNIKDTNRQKYLKSVKNARTKGIQKER